MKCLIRKTVDRLYATCGAMAAVCLASICLLVVAQVGCRLVDAVAKAVTGSAIGLAIPSVAEFAAFLLVGAAFLGLAYSLRQGAHIRVTLLTQRFSVPVQRRIEIMVLALAAAMAFFCAWHATLLVVDSWEFNERSYGVVSVPLWIPQVPMALGLAVLALALIDDALAILRGERASYQLIEDQADDAESMEVAK